MNTYSQVLQQTFKDERASRKSVESKHRRAQNATIRTSRYLDSILTVNQELVVTTSGMPGPQPSLEQVVRKPRGPRATRREEGNGHRPSAQRVVVGTTPGGVDVGAAVEEAVMVGRAGGDPIPSLTALYERIGFCAMQGEDDDAEGMQSLPTSPSRAAVGSIHKVYGIQSDDDEGMSCRWLGDRAQVDGFFPSDGAEVVGSPARWATGRKPDVGSSAPSGNRGDTGKGTGIKGYSFAHTPMTRMTSVGERSPKVMKRLEALASQLERERADVEQWYKSVVHRVRCCASVVAGCWRGSLAAKEAELDSLSCLFASNHATTQTIPRCLCKAAVLQQSSLYTRAYFWRTSAFPASNLHPRPPTAHSPPAP